MVATTIPTLGSKILLAIAVFAAVISPVSAADDAPSGHALIQRFVDACGGHDAYAEIRNRASAARVELPDHGMEGEFIEIIAPPNYRHVLAFDIYGPILTGITDGLPWRKSLSGEPDELEASAAADIKRHGQLNQFLDWTPASGTATVVGSTIVEGDDCYRVEIKPTGGSSLLAFFSKTTGLLRRIDDRAANMFRHFGDYRKLDGVLVPYNVRIDAGMMVFHVEFVAIEHNVDLNEFLARDLVQPISADNIAGAIGLAADGSFGGPLD